VIQIFGTAKCKHTRAAERFFKERAIRVQLVDLKIKGLSRGELESVARAVGGAGHLLDRDGARAKDRGLHVMTLSDARVFDLLLEDPLLLKTPIVRDGREASAGEAKETWKRFAERAKNG
jgi:arsenate reductase